MANDMRPRRRELWETALFSKTEIATEHGPAMSNVCVWRYRPMKDAPKDGTAILALLEGSNIPLPIRWRAQGDPMAKKGPGWYVTWDGHALQPADGPRGWLPIPAEWLPEAQPTAHQALLEALRGILDCPFVIDEATVPRTGIDAAPWQVVGNLSIAIPRMRKARAAVALAEAAQPVQQCACRDRPADQCPGELGPGYDLGTRTGGTE